MTKYLKTSLQNYFKKNQINFCLKDQIFFATLFFKWRIFALQNFVVVCHTSTRITSQVLPMFPSSQTPFHFHFHPPFQIVTEPLLEFPKSYCNFPLAIYFTYGIVNFHVNFSIHLTLSRLPSPHVLRSVFYVCFSIAALKINSSVPSFQIPYICISIQYLYFSFYLLHAI